MSQTKKRHAAAATAAPQPQFIARADLPAIGQRLFDGEFAGIARGEEGGPDVALFDLGLSPKSMTWAAAKDWATSLGATLASRAEGRVLAGNIDLPAKRTDYAEFWLGEQYAGGEAFAWYQNFGGGNQYGDRKDFPLRARAVRRLPIR